MWDTLTAEIDTHRTPIPVSVVSVDAGFLTATVKAQLRQAPMVDSDHRPRPGRVSRIAKVIGHSGLAVVGKDDARAALSRARCARFLAAALT